jgi:hypothetical protein
MAGERQDVHRGPFVARYDQGVVVTVPLRLVVRPRKPVRIALVVHEPFAHDDAPAREAVAPLGAVVVFCDVHDPPAHVADPSCDAVLPAAVVVLPDVVQLPPAHDDVLVWTAPRLLVVVRVAACAPPAAKAGIASRRTASDVFMRVPSEGALPDAGPCGEDGDEVLRRDQPHAWFGIERSFVGNSA